jgi:hypothetical protein
MEITDKMDTESLPLSIDGDIIEAFAGIYGASLLHRFKVAGHSTNGAAMALSDEYTKKLFQLARYYTESLPETNQLVDALNSLFVWKVGEVLLLRPVQARSQGFRQLIEKHFEGGQASLLQKLVFLSPQEFTFHLRDLPYTDQRVQEHIRHLEELVLRLPSGTFGTALSSGKIEDLRDFHDRFTLLKGQFEALNERVVGALKEKEVPQSQDNVATLTQLRDVLGVLSGNIHEVIEHFRHDVILLLGAYISFVDPFLKKAEFGEFLTLWRGKNKPDRLPSFNDELIITVFRHSESPHEFLNAIGPQLPPWFAFHFGDVLLLDDRRMAKQTIFFRQKHLPYPEFLTTKYLEFLGEKKVGFQIFAAYFDRFYRYDDSAPFDLLVPYVVNNHADLGLLSTLKAQGSAWILEIVVEKLFARECASANGSIDDHLRMLYFTESPKAASDLQERLFRALVRQRDNAVWLQEVIGLCESLKRRELTTHLQFEEVGLAFMSNLRFLSATSPDVLMSICADSLQTLPKQSSLFVITLIQLLVGSLAALPSSRLAHTARDTRMRILIAYEEAKARQDPGFLLFDDAALLIAYEEAKARQDPGFLLFDDAALKSVLFA